MAKTKSVQKQNGVVVFAETEVEVSILFNYLKTGKTIETFLENYPQVILEQVLDMLELAEEQLHEIASTN